MHEYIECNKTHASRFGGKPIIKIWNHQYRHLGRI